MKYVILIHSNPQPWGHPTSNYLPEYGSVSSAERQQMDEGFEAMLAGLSAAGELVGGEALADPAAARLYRWRDGASLITDGPYSESKEHLAGFFLIDVESQERAEAIAGKFSGPGETVELRPAMWSGGEDA